ncbi:MAG TPA: ABC transporter permease [Vicinamibacterales bacterium]|nr:ABC transporter permease [Vicinamibacterales bacterium]
MSDLRYAIRTLVKHPGFTAIALLTIALGIGANTAIFSIVSAVLWRPLPYPHSERLMMVWIYNPRQGFDKDVASYPTFTDWRNQSRSFEHLAAYFGASLSLTGAGDPAQLRGARVTPAFFPALNVQPALGRWLTEQDAAAGHERVVMMEHGLWQARFGSDPAIVGRTIQLSGQPYEVVGVMPAGFQYPEGAALWVPLAPVGPYKELMESRGSYWLNVIGRLRPDSTEAAAQTEMNTIARRLEQQYPDTSGGQGVRVTSLHDEIVGDVRRALLVLFGAVGCVLLIACANVANLLLTRATGRHRELAIRAALGAARVRIVRQMLTESLVLALAGAAGGLLLATWAVAALQQAAPTNIPRLTSIAIDMPVLLFTLAMAIATGLIFGVAPAWQSASANQSEGLKEGGRSGGEGSRGRRVRHTLAVIEVAVALVLLVGAGLLARSLAVIAKTDLGFNPRNVLALSIELPRYKYSEDARIIQFYEQASERIAALPGVQSVGVGSTVLLGPLPGSAMLSVEGRPSPRNAVNIPVPYDTVTNGYFKTLGIPLTRGRLFGPEDTAAAPARVVVNQAFVRRFFPSEDPLGKRVTFNNPEDKNVQWLTIVGVVADTRRGGIGRPPWAEVYFPLAQSADPRLTVLVRTAGDPIAMARAAQQQVWAIDQAQPVASIRTLEELLARAQANRRFTMMMLAMFAAVALLLAAVGIYGVIAYSTAQRTHEIGVRVALGATRVDVLQMVLRDGLRIGAAGTVIGIAAAAAASRLLSGLLFGISPHDPLTFVALPTGLLMVALLASWIPARRALAVEPITALRGE